MQSHQERVRHSSSITDDGVDCEPICVSYASLRYVLREWFQSIAIFQEKGALIELTMDYLIPPVAVSAEITRIQRLEKKHAMIMHDMKAQSERHNNEVKESQRRYVEISDLICHRMLNPLNGIVGTLDWLDSVSAELTSLIQLSPKIPEQITRIAEIKDVIQQSANSQKEIIGMGLQLDALSVKHVSHNKYDFILEGKELSGISILMVEDEKINQRILTRMLSKAGCDEYDIANNGREALSKVATKKFDVILMDILMPEMDGLTATSKILKNKSQSGSSVPIIIGLSANVSKEQVQAAKDVGMVDYIPKPYIKKAIIDAILNHTKRKQINQTCPRNHSLFVVIDDASPAISSHVTPSFSSGGSLSSGVSPSMSSVVASHTTTPSFGSSSSMSPGISPSISPSISPTIQIQSATNVSPISTGSSPIVVELSSMIRGDVPKPTPRKILSRRFTHHQTNELPAQDHKFGLDSKSVWTVESGAKELSSQSAPVKLSCCSLVVTCSSGFFAWIKGVCCASNVKISPVIPESNPAKRALGS